MFVLFVHDALFAEKSEKSTSRGRKILLACPMHFKEMSENGSFLPYLTFKIGAFNSGQKMALRALLLELL